MLCLCYHDFMRYKTKGSNGKGYEQFGGTIILSKTFTFLRASAFIFPIQAQTYILYTYTYTNAVVYTRALASIPVFAGIIYGIHSAFKLTDRHPRAAVANRLGSY